MLAQQGDSQQGGSVDPPDVDGLQDYQWTWVLACHMVYHLPLETTPLHPCSMVQALDRCVVALQLHSPALTSLLSEGVGRERGRGRAEKGMGGWDKGGVWWLVGV